MLNLVIFLAVLSVLVLIHELGHFLAARSFGVKVDEFGYGFPPRAIGFIRQFGKWKRVRKEDEGPHTSTIWSLNWLPLGGFVRLKGEDGRTREPDAFITQTIPKRFIILAAGVAMNWLLAAVIFSVGFAIGVPVQTDGLPNGAIARNPRVQITDVGDDSAAASVGMQAGDFIIKIEGTDITRREQVQNAFMSDQVVRVLFEQDNQLKEVTVQPKFVPELNRSGLGVGLADTGIVRFPWYQAIGQGFITTARYTKLIVVGLGTLVKELVVDRHVSSDVSGPVGIAVLTGKIAHQGLWPLMQLMALLSINLALINFLPIPALDGGRVLFLIIEAIRRKQVNQRIESMVHQIGFIALLILIAIVTANDIRQYGGVIWTGLKHLIVRS
ncbi:MAG: M50 family metallopeptidase [bacterium]|nr:M50 family metallopeptidase [bacterium]